MKKVLLVLVSIVLCFSAVYAYDSKLTIQCVPYTYEFAALQGEHASSDPEYALGFSIDASRNLTKHFALGTEVALGHYNFTKEYSNQVKFKDTMDLFASLNAFYTLDLFKGCTYRVGGGFGLNLETVVSETNEGQVTHAFPFFNVNTGFDFHTKQFGVILQCAFKVSLQGQNGFCLFLVPSAGLTFAL